MRDSAIEKKFGCSVYERYTFANRIKNVNIVANGNLNSDLSPRRQAEASTNQRSIQQVYSVQVLCALHVSDNITTELHHIPLYTKGVLFMYVVITIGDTVLIIQVFLSTDKYVYCVYLTCARVTRYRSNTTSLVRKHDKTTLL